MPMPSVVVITGGTAGVGRAAARAFADAGCDVAVLARGEERLAATKTEIEGKGRRAVAISVDVADAAAVERAAEKIERTLGPIDCWVNNAMTTVFSPVMKISAEEFDRVTKVTYLGVVHGTQSALRRMRPRDRGVVIQVGSALAYRGIPLQAAYCAAKHAIVGFTESMRVELMHDKSSVHMTMVHLPAMNTPQFEWVLSRLEKKAQPVPPIYQPEAAARAIVWSATHKRRSILVGWPTIKTVWGNRIAAWYADRVLAKQGYSGQQTDEPEASDRPSNLWEPVPGEYAAHGRFGDRSRERAPATWVSMHPVLSAVIVLLLLLALLLIAWGVAEAL